MLSYKDYKKLNESVLGFGPVTLGLGQPTNMGLVSNQDTVDEGKKKKMLADEIPVDEKPEDKDEEDEEEEKEEEGEGEEKSDCGCGLQFCKKKSKANMTKEEVDFWTSLEKMMAFDDGKGWDGVAAPGEVGFAPVPRVGE